MDLLEIMKNRRSVRTYTGEPVDEEKLERILQAGLLSASGRAIRPWELIVVREKKALKKMAASRAAGAKMLEGADCAVVVLGDAEKTDVWTEDCSIVMANMHLMADSLGVGSCWIHRAKEEFETPWGKELLKSLGIEEDYEGIGHCALGYAEGETPKAAARKDGRVYYIK